MSSIRHMFASTYTYKRMFTQSQQISIPWKISLCMCDFCTLYCMWMQLESNSWSGCNQGAAVESNIASEAACKLLFINPTSDTHHRAVQNQRSTQVHCVALQIVDLLEKKACWSWCYTYSAPFNPVHRCSHEQGGGWWELNILRGRDTYSTVQY